ncbi:hypothetical protein [Glycocaulis sp.]|uniref:hypothetical protein n=1 Tax=Glycocaulis sp. TaxID=1969725 RepID=UPI0025C34DE3|nr:hypothetical protein [Glycocaulis sp.]MCH8522393.1 hypothetical protein [Glycocaulis sp.]
MSVNFAAIKTRPARDLETEYWADADKLFEGRRLTTGKIELMNEWRCAHYAFDDIATDFVIDRKRYTVIFKGPRGEACAGGLRRAITDHLVEIYEKTGDTDIFQSFRMPVLVTGTWKPRHWRDSRGVWRRTHELIAAAWSYTDPQTGQHVEEGRLPRL